MNRKRFQAIASLSFALILILDAAWQARAQDRQMLYPSMAPIEQYLMTDRNAEIALARTAAPEAISRDAKILVLGRHGYETAVEAKNGFVCVVERGWMGHSMVILLQIFGTPKFEARSASIRRLRDPSCHLPTRGRR
jgi:hypothetical protein